MVEKSPLNHEQHQEACVFCDIRDRKKPGSVIAETDESVAIMALEGHPLVMPKEHTTKEDFEENPSLLSGAFALALALAPSVQEAMGAQGMTFVLNLGEAAGQEISHVHVHLFPRVSGDREISYRLSPRLPRPELDSRAIRISNEFEKGTQA